MLYLTIIKNINNMMTAEETYTKVTGCIINHKDVKQAMIEFAKMHVQAALEAAAIDATTKFIPFTDDEEVDRDSIRNAYPLTNIK